MSVSRQGKHSTTTAIDSDCAEVDLTGMQWARRIRLPPVDIQDVYRQIQADAGRQLGLRDYQELVRVNCTNRLKHKNNDMR
ncbi:unnamed protein product [Gongylonema pulchrum]|uniref:PET domain-containing protein n=1 Tax=Gongylonema pulchrum TaxID=637853 RepID=A0A183D4B2_9BILA|nr:unnamed protein product [Gongylonema pulchrum]